MTCQNCGSALVMREESNEPESQIPKSSDV